ncbi:hypothetical protein [Streptomyces sp. AV19]|uniref:hypothetical protein n=1 Tax=Streptomyces sp. AV19 TaxID=2793068 RepID=UPI0024134715|nr:hypothetical protein [Streptomyces sp. AV19]MDG4535279.1 hypothetical protein [Streptomyces sp. AV19]
MNATEEEIIHLLRAGLSNTAISRQLRCDRHRVSAIRHRLGIPEVRRQPLTLEELWAARVRPAGGGHLEWTGQRASGGTPILRRWPKTYSAAGIAFRIKHGRDGTGHVRAECGHRHCVAPDHVDDTITRTRLREQLWYLTGGVERPAQCQHGHDQSEHGRYGTGGRPYCNACKRRAT